MNISNPIVTALGPTGQGGLELVEVWYRPENSGKSYQYEIFNSFRHSAINVHYAFGADAN